MCASANQAGRRRRASRPQVEWRDPDVARWLVAPGEVISLVGSGIGPATGVVYQPGVQGQAPRTLGGVQVFFNGIQAPIIYAQSNQVNAFVPVELSGQTSTTVTLQYQTTTLGPFTQQLAAFDPAIFRWQPGVSSQAAALNEDGSVNGPSNPAAAGSIVSVGWAWALSPHPAPTATQTQTQQSSSRPAIPP